MPFHYRMLFHHPCNHIPFIPFSMNRHPANSGATQTMLQRTWWYYLSLERGKVICFLQVPLAGRHDSLGSFMKMSWKRQSKAKLARHMEKVGRGWHFCYLFVHHCHHNPRTIEQTHTGGLFLKLGSCYVPLLPSALCGMDGLLELMEGKNSKGKTSPAVVTTLLFSLRAFSHTPSMDWLFHIDDGTSLRYVAPDWDFASYKILLVWFQPHIGENSFC